MFLDRLRLIGKTLLFVSSAPVDEVWTRSTAFACRRAGRNVQVVLCGEPTAAGEQAVQRYQAAGIKARQGASLAEAATLPCALAVTASSGLDRKIFPTSAHCFVHMPHSLASLHMIYPAGAFDGYDVLLAAGPQHEREFLALAAARGLSGRRTLAAGYGKLDVLAAAAAQRKPAASAGAKVLIAPSWGPDNLLDRCAIALASDLARQQFAVVIRPHPLFYLEHAPILDELRALVEREPRISLESPLAGDDAIFTADVLVGDYSGIGFEFAALRRRPVVSVDVGLKIANPEWTSLGLEAVEVALRADLGVVVPPLPEAIIAAVRNVLAHPQAPTDSVVARFLHGRPGECGARAARLLDQLLRER